MLKSGSILFIWAIWLGFGNFCSATDSQAAKYKPSHGGYPSYIALPQTISPNTQRINDRDLSLKVGQTIILGFIGVSADDEGVQEVSMLLREGSIAGVIFYGRNIKSPDQLKELTCHFKSVRKDAMILIDQEGGLVQRLNEKNCFLRRYKTAIKSAELSEEEVWLEYKTMAQELFEHGITDNLAPVVDLNTNPDSPAIGHFGRSYSDNPDIVSHLSRIFIDAHKDFGIRTYLKHFPGHGSSTKDSHLAFTDITKTWKEVELLPYKNLIESRHAQAIMTAHVFHTDVDKEFPITLSKFWIKEKLRKTLGFSGVVITDDLHMKGITAKWPPVEAAELAFRAGCDILLFSNNLSEEPMNRPRIHAFISEMVKKIKRGDQELASRLFESYERIMRFKGQ
jgi:beta-N-acetylhexosaminidase